MIQCVYMDKDTEAAFAKLTKSVQDGFAAVDKRVAGFDRHFAAIDQRFVGIDQRFAALEARMEKGFAAIADDIAEVKDQLSSVESKLAGTNRRLDAEALQRTDLALPKRVADLEETTFGTSRHPKHVPLS